MTSPARSSIRRLRAGIVPLDQVERLSVGYESVATVSEASLGTLVAKGWAAPLFIEGEWGSGKSHMLEFIKASATRWRLAHAGVALNARSAPLNYPQRFYPWIAESVCLDGRRGARAILSAAFADKRSQEALLQFAWAEGSGVLGQALKAVISSSREAGSDYLVEHPAWDVVLGADLAPFDYKRTRALERLVSLARLMRSIGGGGLVLALDEAETIDQLWNRLSRMGAYETLGTLCKAKATWVIFGITQRFDRSVSQDLDKGMLLYAPTDAARAFMSSWRDGHYRKFSPPNLNDAQSAELTRLLTEAYAAAYPIGKEAQTAAYEALISWRKNPARNPRRLIRAIVDALDCGRPFSPAADTIAIQR